jgi:hypothetical protein
MKRVYSAPNIAMVAHVSNVLGSYGIDAELRNEYPGGQIPPRQPGERWEAVLCQGLILACSVNFPGLSFPRPPRPIERLAGA